MEQLHLIYKIFQLDSEYKGYSICEDKTTALNNIEKKKWSKYLLIQVVLPNETKVWQMWQTYAFLRTPYLI